MFSPLSNPRLVPTHVSAQATPRACGVDGCGGGGGALASSSLLGDVHNVFEDMLALLKIFFVLGRGGGLCE